MRTLFLAACSLLAGACRVEAPSLTVSAASDLAPAFTEIGTLFSKQTGTRVVFNFGSTGQLAHQIEQGAPVDLFAAASASYIDQLEGSGRILAGSSQIYAIGRLTVWTRTDGPHLLTRIEDLARPEIRRIVIANPEHAPYGIAARQSLESTGVWEVVRPRLVFAENIRQVLQIAETGDVDAAILALSLSISSNGRWRLVPEQLHKPLVQVLAIIQGTKMEAEARSFATFVNGPEGRAVMRRYGFVLFGESFEPSAQPGGSISAP
ncbi:MAG: molybdate ABC transporter substrate-binding protein [Acidobacteriota bacterium]